MSRESRRSLREKSIARKELELGARREIEEFVNPPPDPKEIDVWPDDYDWPDEDYYDDYDPYDYDDYGPYEEDFMDDYIDCYRKGLPGAHYIDQDGRSYLCCLVYRQIVYVDVITGLEFTGETSKLQRTYRAI